MVVVSYSGKEINAKLVYYGAGLSGKTTNLESIYEAVPDGSRGKMVSMKTQSDRTLFFDLLPLDLGEIMGFKTRFLLYTVPGQVFYNATRKLVLKGADAIVFVADSEVGKMEENKDSLANLKTNLAEYGLSLDNIPWVIQYNKRDLPNVYSLEELNAEMNQGGKVPFFEAVAKDGKGVFETFRGISHLLMEKVTRDLRRGPMGGGQPMTQAPPSPLQAAMNAAAPPAPVAAAPAPKPMAEEAPIRPAAWGAPAKPAAANPGIGGLDYGREVELPGEVAQPVPPRLTPVAPEPTHASVAARAPVPNAAPPAQHVVTPPPQAAPAPQPSAVQARVAAVLDQASMPAPPVRAAQSHAAQPQSAQPRPAAPAGASDEVVVPVTLRARGTHEIVLRIVLKVED